MDIHDFGKWTKIVSYTKDPVWIQGHVDNLEDLDLSILKVIEYYEDGRLSRDDNFAVYYFAAGSTLWYKDGLIHRDPDKGPAVEYANGSIQYYVKGEEVLFPPEE